ncbi:UNVERIFIED_CONTAM: hypothetical protein FKN15_030065 [Acipenser sinensis]
MYANGRQHPDSLDAQDNTVPLPTQGTRVTWVDAIVLFYPAPEHGNGASRLPAWGSDALRPEGANQWSTEVPRRRSSEGTETLRHRSAKAPRASKHWSTQAERVQEHRGHCMQRGSEAPKQ